jgi:hypothetical protein
MVENFIEQAGQARIMPAFFKGLVEKLSRDWQVHRLRGYFIGWIGRLSAV